MGVHPLITKAGDDLMPLAGDLACKRSVEQMSERTVAGKEEHELPRKAEQAQPGGGSWEQKLPRKAERVLLAP